MLTNDYVEEVYGSEHVRTDTKLFRVILYAKYEKEDLHKVMETQCQHMTITQRNELLKLLHKLEDFFDGTLGTCKTDPLDFELKIEYEANMVETISCTKGTQEMLEN